MQDFWDTHKYDLGCIMLGLCVKRELISAGSGALKGKCICSALESDLVTGNMLFTENEPAVFYLNLGQY